jgi:hypothetical protein
MIGNFTKEKWFEFSFLKNIIHLCNLVHAEYT